MDNFINYIFSSLTGVIALLGIIMTIFYNILELPNIEISNIIKSPIGKGSFVKVLITVTMISSIILTPFYYFKNLEIFKPILQMGWETLMFLIVSIFMAIVFNTLHDKEKKKLFSKNDTSAMKRQNQKTILSLTKYDVVQIGIYLFNILVLVRLLIKYCTFFYNEVVQIRIIAILIILLIIIMTTLASAYVLGFNNLKSLKKYIIKTDEFEEGQVLALIIAETDSELLIKCEKTYPIILSKSKVSAYMCIDNLTDDEIKYLTRDGVNKDDPEYSGYYLSKEDIKNNTKYSK